LACSRIGETRRFTEFWWQNSLKSEQLKYRDGNGRIILKGMLSVFWWSGMNGTVVEGGQFAGCSVDTLGNPDSNTQERERERH
jgi:hypothetical protein